ncbi:LamG domain-containing protein [Marinimicrobium alkaliphilum]|uniref:LamG domain-containing protein n=1 Tax=Marinimicrobium alkaliphilum TaxID=2202654 RepID=UPI000DB95232|nr:LamG domain-containing protein [Marinimicrobium alkaliphilum]
MTHTPLVNAWRLTTATVLITLLVACGSDSGAPVRENPDSRSPDDTIFAYTGSVSAQTEDVLAFQREVWIGLATPARCGSCHTADGQAPRFARGDDINLAYQEALSLVNLSAPAESLLVTRVAGGHNCWLASPQACADIITGYIAAWADVAGSEATPLVFEAPPERQVGASRVFPANPADTAFAGTVYPLLSQHCAECHSPSAPARQQPFIGSSAIDTAYEAARSRMRLDAPAQSRLVRRLADEAHGCWDDDCAASASAMTNAIAALADGIPETQVDPALNVSRALRLEDGLVATEGGRIDTHVVARYEFKTGSGAIAYDTSGVLDIDLNLSGDVSWMSSWGLRLNLAGGNNGKAQAATSSSRRLHQRLTSAGEYSIEAWVIPDNVVQGDGGMNTARIISYSGSASARNFTLGQSMYNYDFLNRSGATSGNGLPALGTDPDAERLQATLQHVVATFDPVNGRRLYVNGEFTGDEDPLASNLADWDDTFALVVGNEVSSNKPWRGSLRFLALHDRALSPEAIAANYAVGVGARFYLLFNISHLIVDGELNASNNPGAYVVFEVQQFDDYGYLFNQPFVVTLNDDAALNAIPVQGLRIGINGSEVVVGQAYANLNTHLDNADRVEGRLPLSRLGTVIEVQQGPDLDEFFLTFDRIGSHTYARVEAEPTPLEPSANRETQARVALRNFGAINAALARMTSVPASTESVASTYNNVRQQLPVNPGVDGFLAAHQMGVTQLAVAYCSALVDNSAWRDDFFTGVNFSQPVTQALAESSQRARVIDPLLTRLLAADIEGERLPNMPEAGAVEDELHQLLERMTQCTGNCDPVARTSVATKAACAAAMGSAVMLLH